MAEAALQSYKGLTTDEARIELRRTGANAFTPKKRFRPLFIFIQKFNSPLLLILTFAALVSLFLGEHTNGVIIIAMILISGTLDFVNSYRSEKAMARLIARVQTTATVLRDGVTQEIPFADVVPRDVLILSAGDVVPADSHILEARDLFLNQSALSGEAFPVEKTVGETGGIYAMPFENSHSVFAGTNVVTGYGVVRVVATGLTSEFGKIAKGLEAQEPKTDFEKGIAQFSVFIAKITAVLVLFVFFANAYLGKGLFSSFLFALAIAIGLTPELLPVIMAVSLSRGSAHLAKKDVIVKNISAIQNLGSMNILCTDKTGTLTENRITLVRHIDGFGNESEPVSLYSYLSSVFHTGVKGPLDTAIQAYGAEKKISIQRYKKIDEIPFDFERKRDSIVVNQESAEKHLMITKGAPEDILRVVSFYKKNDEKFQMNDEAMRQFNEQFIALSKDGFRVLAVAIKEIENGRTVYSKEEENEMIFLGFTAFIDPPKKTAMQTVRDLAALSVEVKIITGDSEILTKKICEEIGLPIKKIIVGTSLKNLSDVELEAVVEEGTIFARITPSEKKRIILALKRRGHTVGYLGDGINDAPALHGADIGISVSNGADVAKETADIILTHKSLRVLYDGIVEGRRVFQNTMKYISMGLSSNFGNMASMTAASVVLPFLPMLPTQILLNNFLYDTSQFALTTDAVDREDILKPIRWNMGFIKRYMVVFGLLSSVFDFLTFAFLFFVLKSTEAQFQTGWFMESLATQVFVIYIIRTRKIPFLESSPSHALMGNTLFMVILGWTLPLLALGGLFSFAMPTPVMYLGIAIIIVIYLFVAQITKQLFYRHYARAS
ncbi:MAG: magnesium-translocating P-type ATPase [Candidatus Paceibacterota bacterium]|jgi:Mg2+-importing ATPase